MPSPACLVRPTLLAAALCAANLAVAAQPASAPFTPAQQQAIRQISASEAQAQVPQVASAAAASVAKTIEGEKQAIEREKQIIGVAKDALEVGRKSVDWWLSNISVWLGGLGLLIGVAGIGIPLWMGRKQKAEWQEKLADITQKLTQAQTAQQQAEAAQQQAEQHAREIETLLHTARDKASLIPSAEDIKGELSGELLARLQAEKPPQVVKLIQQAWEAHNKEDWAAAKPLWALLSLIESQDANVWFNLAYAEQHSGEDWQLICDAYQRAHLLEPSAFACNNWGTALSHWAKTMTGDVQQQRFAEADQRYAEATRLKPDFTEAYSNWGAVLSVWAKTLTDGVQQRRFAEADQRFAEATRLKQDFAEAYSNWGNALLGWAKTLTGEARQQRLAEADQRFAEATRLRPDFAEAYSNWGNALFSWAKILKGEAQQQRYAEADQRFAEATRLKPDFAVVYYNWGITLLHWVHTLPSDERAAKLDEAERVLLLGKEKGSKNLYDLACLRAMQQRPEEARALLQETRSAGLLPDFAHLSTDRDLENLRGLDWFQALLEEVKQQEAGKQGST